LEAFLAHEVITRAAAPPSRRWSPGRVVGEITLDQLPHARREDLREEEHRERLPLVLIPPGMPRAGRPAREMR
jgi:hypothetical protein